MSYTWNEINEGIQDARNTINKADFHVDQMARLICGKLKSSDVSGDVLACLKKELRSYNIHTYKWK